MTEPIDTLEEVYNSFSQLDEPSFRVLVNNIAEPSFGAYAPMLRDWLDTELAREWQRREAGKTGRPAPLPIDGWSDQEVGLALSGCLMMHRAIVLPMQQEFTDHLLEAIGIRAAERLVRRSLEAGMN